MVPQVNMVNYDRNPLEAKARLIGELMGRNVNQKQHVIEAASAFDTEASSFIDLSGQEAAICYIWQFGIENTVIYGRYMEGFQNLLATLNDYLQSNRLDLITYVHFFKYDFTWIRAFFKWDKIFFRENRYPLYAKTGRIEFRDSLALSGGQSLNKIGKGLRNPVLKAVGDLDYDLVRTSNTPMTDLELHYCEMDIRVLVQYIREKMEDEGTICNIPLTNTGYVRRYVRNACFRNKERYLELMDNLTLDVDAYRLCEQTFAGGDTGPNIKYVGKVLENVGTFDIKSSYPYAMCTQYFPMSYPIPVDVSNRLDKFEEYLSKYCCMFVAEFYNIRPSQDNLFPMHRHKALQCIGEVVASGRIMEAMYVRYPMTELDWITFNRAYTYDHVDITRMKIMERGTLPVPIISSILKFFVDKTTLDGIADRKADYMIAKNMLNSVFGMMVEKPVKPEYKLTEEGFSKFEPDYVSAVEEYNNKINRFTFYPWGVWVTAWARFRLYEVLFQLGDDFVYCDTDCAKFLHPEKYQHIFDSINEAARQSAINLSNRLDIPLDNVAPVAPDGDRKFLGVWEEEKKTPYRKFKTIGAKRYLVEYQDGTMELTAAGTNKAGTLEFILQEAKETGKSPFEIFDDGLGVPAKYAKRTISTFIDKEVSGYVEDYLGNREFYSVPNCIHVVPSGYHFGVTEEMYDAIMMLTHEGGYQEGDIE